MAIVSFLLEPNFFLAKIYLLMPAFTSHQHSVGDPHEDTNRTETMKKLKG